MLIWKKKIHSDKSDFEAGGGFISQRFLLFRRTFWAADENKVARRASLASSSSTRFALNRLLFAGLLPLISDSRRRIHPRREPLTTQKKHMVTQRDSG